MITDVHYKEQKSLEQTKLIFMQSIEYNFAPKAFAKHPWPKNTECNIGQTFRYQNEYVLSLLRIELLKKKLLFSLHEA
jgi:hypothetical protein